MGVVASRAGWGRHHCRLPIFESKLRDEQACLGWGRNAWQLLLQLLPHPFPPPASRLLSQTPLCSPHDAGESKPDCQISHKFSSSCSLFHKITSSPGCKTLPANTTGAATSQRPPTKV